MKQFDNQPYRLKMGHNFKQNKVKANDFYSKFYRNGQWDAKLFKIRKIITNSVGKDADTVFSRICKIFPKNCNYTPIEFWRFFIHSDKRTNCIKDVYGMYIDKHGIIQNKKFDYRRRTKDTIRLNNYYKSEWLKKKAIQQEEQKLIINTLMKLINNRIIYDKYCELLNKKKECSAQILYKRLPKSANKWDKLCYLIDMRKHHEASEQLPKIIEKIKQIENRYTNN